MTSRPILALLGMSLLACDSDPVSLAPTFDDRQIVTDFADAVVIPTYQLLATRAIALEAAVDALVEAPDDALLEAAREAWIAARSPWEQSEGFLFGPVDTLGIDPALDTWPLNETDLLAVLASPDSLTGAFVNRLPPSQKGFHALEFLLFGRDATHFAADLDPRELAYLAAIADDFTVLTARLAKSWTDGEGGLGAYRDIFVTAGEPGNSAYPSLSSALQEMILGMAGICDEVANGKIADPFDNRDPLLEESQFSHNSLLDFQDNVRSVRNAYLGGVPDAGTTGRGLSAWVLERDAMLDTDIRQAIETAINAIGNIPAPFSEAILDPASADEIVTAQEAVRALHDLLVGRLSALAL